MTTKDRCGALFTAVSAARRRSLGQTFVCERDSGHEERAPGTGLGDPGTIGDRSDPARSAETASLHRVELKSETGWTATVVWISEPEPASVERAR